MKNAADLVNDIDAHSDKKTTDRLHHTAEKSIKIVALERHYSQEFSSKDLNLLNKTAFNKDKDAFQRPKAIPSKSTEKTQKNTDTAAMNVSSSEVMNCNSNNQTLSKNQKRKQDMDADDNDNGVFNVESKRIKSEHELLVSVVSSLQSNQEKDETDDVFGKYVGREIANIVDFRSKQMAKFKILNMIFDAQFVNDGSSSSRNCTIQSPQIDFSSMSNTRRELSDAKEEPDNLHPAIQYPEIKGNDLDSSITLQHKNRLSNTKTQNVATNAKHTRRQLKRRFSDGNGHIVKQSIVQKYNEDSSDDRANNADGKCSVNVVTKELQCKDEQAKISLSNSDLGDGNQRKGVSDIDAKEHVPNKDIKADDQSSGVVYSDVTADIQSKSDVESDVTANVQSIEIVDSDVTSDTQSKGMVNCDVTADIQSKRVVNCDVIADTQSKGVVNSDVIADTQSKGMVNSDVIADTQSKGMVNCDVIADTQSKGMVNSNVTANTLPGTVDADVTVSKVLNESVTCAEANAKLDTKLDTPVVNNDELINRVNEKEEQDKDNDDSHETS